MNGSLSDGRQKVFLNWESKPQVPPCLKVTNVFVVRFAWVLNEVISLLGNAAELADPSRLLGCSKSGLITLFTG